MESYPEEPELEATFLDESDANRFCEEWKRIQPHHEFWVVDAKYS